MQSRLAVVLAVAGKCRRVGEKMKGEMLDSLVRVTGYDRSHASHLLGLCGRRLLVKGSDGKM